MSEYVFDPYDFEDFEHVWVDTGHGSCAHAVYGRTDKGFDALVGVYGPHIATQDVVFSQGFERPEAGRRAWFSLLSVVPADAIKREATETEFDDTSSKHGADDGFDKIRPGDWVVVAAEARGRTRPRRIREIIEADRGIVLRVSVGDWFQVVDVPWHCVRRRASQIEIRHAEEDAEGELLVFRPGCDVVAYGIMGDKPVWLMERLGRPRRDGNWEMDLTIDPDASEQSEDGCSKRYARLAQEDGSECFEMVSFGDIRPATEDDYSRDCFPISSGSVVEFRDRQTNTDEVGTVVYESGSQLKVLRHTSFATGQDWEVRHEAECARGNPEWWASDLDARHDVRDLGLDDVSHADDD